MITPSTLPYTLTRKESIMIGQGIWISIPSGARIIELNQQNKNFYDALLSYEKREARFYVQITSVPKEDEFSTGLEYTVWDPQHGVYGTYSVLKHTTLLRQIEDTLLTNMYQYESLKEYFTNRAAQRK